MVFPRECVVNQGKTSETLDLWQLTLNYLEGRQVPSLFKRLEGVTLNDLFHLLERLTSLVKHTELRRIRDLLVELTIIRDNTILHNRSTHEEQLLKTMKQSSRLGEVISIILTGLMRLD